MYNIHIGNFACIVDRKLEGRYVGIMGVGIMGKINLTSVGVMGILYPSV